MEPGSGSFGTMFALVAVVVGVGFVVVLALVLVGAGKGIGQWRSNNAAPVTTVPAVVVAKREQVSGGSGDTSATSSYFVTFETGGGERVELALSGCSTGCWPSATAAG